MVFAFNKKSAKRATRQKRISGRWAFMLVWLRRFGVSLAVTTAIAWVGTWLWLSGSITQAGMWAENQFLTVSNDMGFSVENILVEGRVNTDSAVLLGLMNVEEGDPLFSFDPAAAKTLIERITWVEKARIERRFPNTIYVDIQERMPLALHSKGKKLVLLDQKGEVITDHNLSRFKDLVRISGKGAAQKAPELMSLLRAEPDLFPLIRAAKRVSDRRWDLQLKSGLTAQLPEQDIGLALRRIVEAQKQDGLLDKNIKAIDMREADRIIIRTHPGAVQEYKVNYNKNAAKNSSNI